MKRLLSLSIVLLGMSFTTAFATTSKLEQQPKATFTKTFEFKADVVNVETFDFIQVEQKNHLVKAMYFIENISKAKETENPTQRFVRDVGWQNLGINYTKHLLLESPIKRMQVLKNSKCDIIRIRNDS